MFQRFIEYKDYNSKQWNSDTYAQLLFIFISHLAIIPLTIFFYKNKKNINMFFNILHVTNSFMYHIINLIGCEKLFLEQQEFQKLDFTGQTMMIISLFIYLADFQSPKTDITLTYFYFTIVLIVQEMQPPINLYYTIIPILAALLQIFIFRIYQTKTNLFQLSLFKSKAGLTTLLISLELLIMGELIQKQAYIFHFSFHATQYIGMTMLWKDSRIAKISINN